MDHPTADLKSLDRNRTPQTTAPVCHLKSSSGTQQHGNKTRR
ncbi:hypothetical protein RISK_001667 [Rhodopirellula islandica]|uniref:Uncharacterized protein n=1 Tax=Rhodopirellula islandica TaxID=595434 RepID=A0A0J1BIT8_RHOIS|nr:hypothetical protein RISK_001667 [Rhodopirellula islandica]